MSANAEDDTAEETENKDEKVELNPDVKGWSPLRITIEPVMFFIPFINNFTSGITIDLLQQSVCHEYFSMSYEECQMKLPVAIKADVEAKTADVNMYNNLIQGICPIILVLCVGPWSDRNGRKPFLYWGLRGFILFYFLWGLLSLVPFLSAQYFLIPAIPLSLSGGMVSILVSCQTYMADIWPYDVRPFRIGVVMFASVIGSVAGNALSTPVVYWCGRSAYQVMYFSSALIALLTHFYVQFFVEETVVNKGKRTRLLDLSHMKSITKVLIYKPVRGRFITLMTMTILTTEITSGVGESNLIYLIGKSSFDWTLGDYNLYSSVVTVIQSVSPVVGMWILKEKLKWHSYSILVFSSSGMFTFNMLKSFSETQTMFWLVSFLSRMITIIGPCIDTELALLVKKTDLGKAFAFSSLLDAISPVVTLPLFNQLYKAMLPDRTLRMYLLSSLFSSITAASSIALLWKKNSAKDIALKEGIANEGYTPQENA